MALDGNANITARLDQQFDACGRNITISAAWRAAGAAPLLAAALGLAAAALLTA